MEQVVLLNKIARDIEHMKLDIEEIRELVYPPEEKINIKLVKAVNDSEKHYKEGKFRELKSAEDIDKLFT